MHVHGRADLALLHERGRERIGHDRAVQGNLDPLLLCAPVEIAKRRTTSILDEVGGRNGHIFNLGHGITPETPVDTVKAIIDHVHEHRRV